MTKLEIKQLSEQGFTVLRNQIPVNILNKLSDAIDNSFIKQQAIYGVSEGVALHALLNDYCFIDFIAFLIKKGFIKELEDGFFESKCILNSFSALDNIPNKPNFSINVHRDLRFYSQGLNVMLNCLIMVDDFTVENGGTLLQPWSHLVAEYQGDEHFHENKVQITGKRGDILLFNANVFYSSARNTTKEHRRAIPMTVSKSFMKQLLDYPRAFGYERVNHWDEELLQFLGYDSRVPASLDEWNQPEDKRFYKKGQD